MKDLYMKDLILIFVIAIICSSCAEVSFKEKKECDDSNSKLKQLKSITRY